MTREFHFSLKRGTDGKRLDRVLLDYFPDLSRSAIKKLIERGCITVDGVVPKKAGTQLKEKCQISVIIPPTELPDLSPEEIEIEILYEDDSLAVVNKAAGIVVHPSPGHPSGTLVNALLFKMDTLSAGGEPFRPGIVHRLDRDTSGVMVVAKNDRDHMILQEQFAAHSIGRKYHGFVFGRMKEKEGIIATKIGRHPKERKKMAVVTRSGRRAVTRYRVIEEVSDFSMVEYTLETGRTHQIRVHSSHLGHPVVGDPLYSRKGRDLRIRERGKEKRYTLTRNLLHAFHLSIDHPRSAKRMEFTIPDPYEFTEFRDFLEKP